MDPVAIPGAHFEVTDVGLEEAQYSSLSNFLQILASILHGLSNIPVVEDCLKVLLHLVSRLPYDVRLSLHAKVSAPTLWPAWALSARCHLGRKHSVSHIGGNITDAGDLGDWRQCCTHFSHHLASKVRISHQLL